MKRILFAVLLLLGMSALVISCNKDNSKENPSDYSKLIVGTWLYAYDGIEESSVRAYYVFQDDGVFFTRIVSSTSGTTETPKLRYTISGNKLTVMDNFTVTILNINSKEMLWDTGGVQVHLVKQ